MGGMTNLAARCLKHEAAVPDISQLMIEQPDVDWVQGRPYAHARLNAEDARTLENLAIEKEATVRALPVDPGWLTIAEQNPTTARYSSYSSFLLDPRTLPLFFAIRQTYRHLIHEMQQEPRPRFIQCWYNVHRGGESLVRHRHPYPFIGTFSAHAEDSATRYGTTRETSESDVMVEHAPGQLLLTTGPGHYHETSIWTDFERPRITYAFDIVNAEQWNPDQIFLPFDM